MHLGHRGRKERNCGVESDGANTTTTADNLISQGKVCPPLIIGIFSPQFVVVVVVREEALLD